METTSHATCTMHPYHINGYQWNFFIGSMTFHCCPCLWLRNHKPQPLGVVEGLFQLVLGSAEPAPSKITSPADVCQVTRLEEGLLPTLRNAEGSGSMVLKIYPHTHGISWPYFIISSWKNIGKSGFYMFPPNPTFAHTQITHLRRSGHTTAL